eukprot:COSAG04_NODE_1198_length_7778_cov_17.966402_3_plen_225_part_00
MPHKGKKKRKKRKHSAAPAPAPPAGEPLEQLEPGTRVAARDDSAAVWLAVFDGWVCDERHYARLRYLHWDSAGTPEVGIVPADWLLPEPDQRSKRPCDLRQGDVGLTEAEQDGGSVMMLARVLRVEGSVPVCRFLPRRDSRTFEFTSGSWWPVQRFAPLQDGRSQYLCVPTKQPSVEESDPRHRAMFTAYQLQQYDKEPGSVISQMSLCSTVRACPDKPPPSQP